MKAAPPCTMCLALLLAAEPHNLDVIDLNEVPCDPASSAKLAKGKALNIDKNHYQSPRKDDIHTAVSVAAVPAPGNDPNPFSTKQAARSTAYVIYVNVGGNEACNCNATNINSRYTHIELALSKNATERQRIIVEVPPQLRKPK